jgi:SAM-dependent methyltransferase
VSGSVSFDRAASYYDRTRALTPEASAEITRLLSEELRSRGPVLEIGVGTGLIAAPLREAGLWIAGIDVSRAMLEELRRKAGGAAPFPVVQGDATSLPFAEDAFGGAIARHVLHLIPDWRGAVAELVRVARPGGVLVVGLGYTGGPFQEVGEHLERIVGLRARRPGLQPGAAGELDAAVASLGGGTARELPTVWQVSTYTIDTYLAEIEGRVHSWTWAVEPASLRAAVDDTRGWARARYGPLDRVLEPRFPIPFRAYDLR